MQIDVTEFCSDPDRLWDLAHSAFEEGCRSGETTCWRSALEAAEEFPIVTADNREAFEDWVSQLGAWERAEISAWSDRELAALVLQFVAGDARTYDDAADAGELDAYMEREGGAFHRDDEGRAFYYFGI